LSGSQLASGSKAVKITGRRGSLGTLCSPELPSGEFYDQRARFSVCPKAQER
jgi:hypothetical protein